MNVADKLAVIAENTHRVFVSGSLVGEQRGYTNGYIVGYEDGHVNGSEEEKAKCSRKHFSQIVRGDGSSELKFNVPFEPDSICVTCHDPDLRVVRGIISLVQMEPCAFGQIAGSYCITSGPSSGTSLGSYVTGLNPLQTISSRYNRDADGLVTLKNFVTSTSPSIKGSFGADVDYIVTATKIVGKTDKERITEALSRLPRNPAAKYSVHISKAKKESAFPNDANGVNNEWEALLSGEPVKDYTISLF